MYRCLIWFDLRTGHCFSNRGMESRPHPRFNQGIDSKMTALSATDQSNTIIQCGFILPRKSQGSWSGNNPT